MATINVTSLSDSGAGTLRQAITDLNAQVGSHTITFTGLSGTITLASALPTLSRSMTITGPGLSNLTISGNNLYRVFVLASTSFTFNISGLTIANGRAAAAFPGYLGGGIYNPVNGSVTSTLNIDSCYFTGCYSGFGVNGIGSAIYTQGNLTVTNTSFVNNTGVNTSVAVVASIGGTATIGNCTFSGNTGTPYYNNANNACTIYNCTFSGNTSGSAGGILFSTFASVSLLSSTISGNTGTNGSGLYVGEYVSLTLKNSIISGNTGSNDFYSYQNNRAVASAATNIIGTISAASAASAARVIGDPLLVALASNGGLTQTMAVSAGSVAIGAGNAAASNASPVSGLDQRGTTRSATAPTIGAYEYVAATTTTTTTTPAPSTFNFPTSPSTGQVYTFNGIIWVWNGIGWKKRLILPSQDIFMSSNYGGL